MPLRHIASLFISLLMVASMPIAHAHHGWSWTTGESIELTGTIVESNLGNPHGALVLDVDGTRWSVEVGQPWRNERAGVDNDDLVVGAVVRVSGEPSRDPEEKRLKVIRMWINDTLHELYPGRT